MRRNRISFYLLLSVLFVLTSCLGDDDSSTVYPDDVAITSFTLGTLKQYITTKSKNGADSTYSKDVTGSKYKFYIDQINHKIYNPDSLPYGTDVKHVLCSVTSKNSGTITILKLNSDTLFYYNSTDSIDFTTQRIFKVFSLDGKNSVDYTVDVNVHQELPDTFLWNNIASNMAFANASSIKALACHGKMYVVADNGQSSVSTIFSTSETDGTEWEPLSWRIDSPLPQNASQNIVTKDDYLYLYNANAIYRSSDGEYWDRIADVRLTQLVAAVDNSLFAIDMQGNLVISNDEGATWNIESLDDDASLLPTQDLSYCVIPSRTNTDVKTIMLIGNRNATTFPNDFQAQVWGKIMEKGDINAKWMYINPNDLYHFALPRLTSLHVVTLGTNLLATGGDGFGASTVSGFSKLYYSNDGGIYWRTNSAYTMPDDFQSTNVFTMAADSQNNVWMICGGNGNVWKGHLSGEGWTKNPTAFTE